MDNAFVVRRASINSRPQWALIIHSINGYCVCVVDKAFPIVEGQELSRHPTHRGVWVLSGSDVVFPSSVHGGMSLNEAEGAISRIAR